MWKVERENPLEDGRTDMNTGACVHTNAHTHTHTHIHRKREREREGERALQRMGGQKWTVMGTGPCACMHIHARANTHTHTQIYLVLL